MPGVFGVKRSERQHQHATIEGVSAMKTYALIGIILKQQDDVILAVVKIVQQRILALPPGWKPYIL